MLRYCIHTRTKNVYLELIGNRTFSEQLLFNFSPVPSTVTMGRPRTYCVLLFSSGRKIRPDVLIDWAIQIARGMAYLHDGAPISLGELQTLVSISFPKNWLCL